MVYMGSKTKYAKYIVPILQKEVTDWHPTAFVDLCCGGCNIVDKIQDCPRIAIDKNPYLIALYEYAVGGYTFPEHITREDWDSCKNHPEDNPAWKVGLVSYFASYSARGFGGGFCLNADRDYYNERLRNFQKQLPLLRDVQFKCQDIFDEEILKTFDTSYLIYIDPPYKGVKGYDYSKNFDHEKFWDVVRKLSKMNTVYVSEMQAPDDFDIVWSMETKRNCFGAKANDAKECLFTWKR